MTIQHLSANNIILFIDPLASNTNELINALIKIA